MITVTAKTESGAIMDFQFQEIVSVDGRPYEDAGSMRDVIMHMQGRLEAIEAILSGAASPSEEK